MAFPIPSSLQDLERSPYNLLPYPDNFLDDDETTRAESFLALISILEQGNRELSINVLSDNNEEPWLDEERLQALYTLVRKSTSIEAETRQQLIHAVCQAVRKCCNILSDAEETVTQAVRDALACHLYFLYSLMFVLDADNKNKYDAERAVTADTMLHAAQTMAKYRNLLWKRGVPDEAVVNIPCRIAYVLLQKATTMTAAKAACAEQAINMVAVSVDEYDSLLTAVSAALMDLMHSHEHMAALTAQICIKVSDKLSIELLRETGRLDGSAKASGVKFVAPFISEMAQLNPKLLLQNISCIMPLLDSEPYNMRSAIVTACASIIVALAKEESNETNKARDALLNILTERIYDVSSYTRSATLKAWISLVQEQVLPKERVRDVTSLAMDRLQDKTVVVRKQSMQLLTSLLEHNPYLGALDPIPYRVKLEQLVAEILRDLPPHIAEAHREQTSQENSADVDAAALQAVVDEVNTWCDRDDLNEQEQTYQNKIQALQYTQSALEFIESFENAHVALEGMLLSANSSDVTEALRFFVKARHFQLPCAIPGMKRALALMWSSEASIRDEVLKAFVDVFLVDPAGDLLKEHQIAKNLLVLTGQASVSELASIEEAIGRLVKEEKIPANVFLILWSVASKGSGDARAAALQLLAMGASADRGIIDSKSRLKLLLEAGLGEYMQEHHDWRLAAAAATALQRTGRAKIDPTDAKYLVLERIMEELVAVARGDLCKDEDENDSLQWFSAAEKAIKALFVISPTPEVACSTILQGMYSSTFESDDSCHSLRLARFFHILGQISISLLVYTEALSSSVRRANAKKSLKKQEEADKTKQGSKEENAIEAELGVAAEVEAENERKMAEISENEILGRGLVSVFSPLLVRVVANEDGRYQSEILRQAAALSLCKFMSVSSSFCEKYLPLLFSALANAPPEDTVMRANTVVALGDLAFRFPNEVEPYTPRLYACLRDPSTKVRRHTLMVLTHLILNDMVKVKGQVCEIALCLRDNDPRIRDMSRLLFHELSKRSNNPIYNLLPDIISQLSQLMMKQEDFRNIMGFLLGFIKKDRQNEMLTEKLCQRFPKCDSIHQKADLAFCIAQLKMNEKSIKTLSDNFKLYKDALFDDDVKKSFTSIIVKAKKFMKPEMKQFLEEWETKLDELAALGTENQVANEKAIRAKARASRRAVRKMKELERIAEDEGFEEEDEENELSFDKENAPVRRAGRRRISESSVENEEK